MSCPRNGDAAWAAVVEALEASATATQTAWDRWRSAHDALMAKLRREPKLRQAWRVWLQAEAQAESGPADV